MKVLVVEDDAKIADFICRGLQDAGATVDCAVDGPSGLEKGSTQKFDVVVVDLTLPGFGGLDLIEKLRKAAILTPILIISARHEVDDRVEGLRKGGDDYLTKPFAFSEFLARIEALVRRSCGMVKASQLSVGDLRVDLATRAVTRGGLRIELQLKEYDLLIYLMENAGRIVSKAMIVEHVWKYNFDPRTNIVEARICKLREKIEPTGASPLVHTIRGVGYVLRVSD